MQKIRRFESEEDSGALYELVRQHELYDAFPGRLEAVNAQELQSILTGRLEGYYHDLYVAEEDGAICGFFLAYDYRVYDRHCRVCGYLDGGMDGGLLKQFTDMLFEEYPLNKVFTEVVENDWDMWKATEKAGFVTEAVLKARKFVKYEYYDVYIQGLYPDRK